MEARLDTTERQRQEAKQSYAHIMRAKLYGVLAINTIEGIASEIDNLLPYDMEKDNVDVLSDQFRKFHGNFLHPTSYGDHMDRAIKSLSKDLGIAVAVDLVNTQAVKKILMRYIRTTNDEERQEMADWLGMQNESIMKSRRFDDLIDKCCQYFYKKSMNEVSDDNLSFIRRSANELLRNKASKEALRKKLTSPDYHYDDDEDMDITLSMYTLRRGVADPHMVVMGINDSSVIPNAGMPMNEMSGMTPIPPMMGMGNIPMTYEMPVMPHLSQIPNASTNMMSTRDVETAQASAMGMSLPMSMPQLAMNNMASIHSIGQMQLPVGVNLPAMGVGVGVGVGVGMMDGGRGYAPVTSTMEMAVARPVGVDGEEEEDQPTVV